MSARLRLREDTRAAHEAVDAAYSGFDLSTTEGYRAFLTAQALAFLPIEAAADRAGAGDLLPDWSARRRSRRLKDDLADLGVPPSEDLQSVELCGVPDVLGAVYVLEGSRLGGRLLHRHLPADAPSRFLGDDDYGPRWRALTRLLDERLTDPHDIEAAVASARSTFDCFLIAARTRLHP